MGDASAVPTLKIAQHNIIIDVLGGVSRETIDSIKELVSGQIRSY